MRKRSLPPITDGTFVTFLVDAKQCGEQRTIGDSAFVSKEVADGLVELDIVKIDHDRTATDKTYCRIIADQQSNAIINMKHAFGATIDEHRTQLECRTSMAKSFGFAPDEVCADLVDGADDEDFSALMGIK